MKIPYGLPLGPEEAQAEALMWMLSGGGGYTDRVGNYTIDSPANVRTFNWLRDKLVARGLTEPHTRHRTDRQDALRRVRTRRGRHAQRPPVADAAGRAATT